MSQTTRNYCNKRQVQTRYKKGKPLSFHCLSSLAKSTFRLQSAPMLPPEAAKQKQLRQNSSPRSNRGGRQKGRANNPRPQYSELDVNVSQQQSEPQQKWAEQQHPQNLEKNQYVIPPHVPTQPSQNPGPNLPPYILSNQIQQIIGK